jgi:hypothetical protein
VTEAAPPGRELEVEAFAVSGEIAGLGDRAVVADEDTTDRLSRLDGRLDDDAAELLGIERRSERLAEADVRLAESPALFLEIDHARFELRRHLVEGTPERCELVTAPHLHALS